MCQVLQSLGVEELEHKRTIEKISYFVQYHSGKPIAFYIYWNP